MRKYGVLLVLAVIAFTGCTTTQQGASIGGLSGAALGGIIGHQSDHGVEGAAIGGAVGAVGGMLVGEHVDQKFCPTCGRAYPSDTRFCPVDGTELRQKQ